MLENIRQFDAVIAAAMPDYYADITLEVFSAPLMPLRYAAADAFFASAATIAAFCFQPFSTLRFCHAAAAAFHADFRRYDSYASRHITPLRFSPRRFL